MEIRDNLEFTFQGKKYFVIKLDKDSWECEVSNLATDNFTISCILLNTESILHKLKNGGEIIYYPYKAGDLVFYNKNKICEIADRIVGNSFCIKILDTDNVIVCRNKDIRPAFKDEIEEFKNKKPFKVGDWVIALKTFNAFLSKDKIYEVQNVLSCNILEIIDDSGIKTTWNFIYFRSPTESEINNKHIHCKLNKTKFKVGDKIIAIKDGYYGGVKIEKTKICKGQKGTVTRVFDDGEYITFGESNLSAASDLFELDNYIFPYQAHKDYEVDLAKKLQEEMLKMGKNSWNLVSTNPTVSHLRKMEDEFYRKQFYEMLKLPIIPFTKYISNDFNEIENTTIYQIKKRSKKVKYTSKQIIIK